MIPVFQGIKKEVVNKICHQGFGTASVLDEGFYGKGSFFLFLSLFSQSEIIIIIK
mgnify:CR=1 FL=1